MMENKLYGITGVVQQEVLNLIQQKIFELKVSDFQLLYELRPGCCRGVGSLETQLNYEEFNKQKEDCVISFNRDVEAYKKAINQFIDLQLKIQNT